MRLENKWKAYIFLRFLYSCMLLLGLLGTFRAQAAPPIEIQSDVLEQVIDGNTEFIFDASSMYTVQSIQAVTEWREPDGEPFSKGLDEGVMWLRFRLINPTNQSEERVLQFSNGHADRLTVWVTDENSSTEKFEIGQDAPLQERPIKHFIPRVPIRVDAGAEKSVVLRIEDEGTMSGSLRLAKLDILQSQEMSSHLVTGLMTGIFGLMGIYAFALFLWLRKPIFGWLSALAICSLLQWMVFNWGEAGLLVPVESRAWLTNRLIIVFLSGSVFCTFLFYVEACSLRTRFPRLSRLILWFAWFELSNSLLVFVLPYIQSVRIIFFGAVGFLALVCAVLYQAIQGDKMSRQLVLAASWLLIGYLLVILTEYGIISFNVLSDHYITLGTLGQWLLLGGAVGLHASQMEEQRREALEAQIMEERRNNELRDAFGRYVAPDLAAKLLKDPDAMKMGGRLQNITILMSDLRGFTGMTKLLGPPAMCELLNDYLSRMTEVIERHGGWVNEFIGDAILTIFGTPVSGDEDAMNACRCAIDMQLALQKLNQELASAGRPTLEMGIGLHTGDAIVGNIGSKRRVKWGVIGDPVNMTARIESLTVGTQVLMSTDVLALVEGRVEVMGFRNVNVKGRGIPLEVAELRGIVGENLTMPVLEEVFYPVNLRGRLRRMQGKAIEEGFFSINIVQLGRLGLRFRSESLGSAFDVSIELETEDGFSLPIYGKVKNLHADHPEMLKEVVFTSSNAQLERRMKVILEKKSTSE